MALFGVAPDITELDSDLITDKQPTFWFRAVLPYNPSQNRANLTSLLGFGELKTISSTYVKYTIYRNTNQGIYCQKQAQHSRRIKHPCASSTSLESVSGDSRLLPIPNLRDRALRLVTSVVVWGNAVV